MLKLFLFSYDYGTCFKIVQYMYIIYNVSPNPWMISIVMHQFYN